MPRKSKPFWERKSLAELTAEEWESLCDGCGWCCTYKLEDENSGELYQTSVCCKLLDTQTGLCSNYPQRKKFVKDCVQLTPENVLSFDWLPSTCGYVRIARGMPLPEWHHLISGDRNKVHELGMSMRGRVQSELKAGPLEQNIIGRFKL